jgi:hypothetical protein
MNTRQFFVGRTIGFLVLTALIGGFFLFNSFIYNEKQGDGIVPEPYRATLSGTYVCLPHKNTDGPQTMECAFGLQTPVGEYYALDFNLLSQGQPSIVVGDTFSAAGTVTPIEYLSSNQWQQYPIEGIFSVTDSVQKL